MLLENILNTQVMVNKPEARAYFKQNLDFMTAPKSKEELDQLLNENLNSLLMQLFPEGQSLIGAYQAFKNEPLLNLPNSWLLSYPVVESKNQMSFYMQGEDELVPSALGIKEPIKRSEDHKELSAHQAFIIPAIGFDQNGHRLGYGGGFYDRYLNNTNKIKIGVGYCVQITDGLWPVDEHDIQLNYIVTEKYVIKINN